MTAMQELISALTNNGLIIINQTLIDTYIEKEKEQIIDAHIEGQRIFDNHTHTQWTNDQAEEYYNKTYNQNK